MDFNGLSGWYCDEESKKSHFLVKRERETTWYRRNWRFAQILEVLDTGRSARTKILGHFQLPAFALRRLLSSLAIGIEAQLENSKSSSSRRESEFIFCRVDDAIELRNFVIFLCCLEQQRMMCSFPVDQNREGNLEKGARNSTHTRTKSQESSRQADRVGFQLISCTWKQDFDFANILSNGAINDES